MLYFLVSLSFHICTVFITKMSQTLPLVHLQLLSSVLICLTGSVIYYFLSYLEDEISFIVPNQSISRMYYVCLYLPVNQKEKR